MGVEIAGLEFGVDLGIIQAIVTEGVEFMEQHFLSYCCGVCLSGL
jgi:hypothetical protein